MVLSLGGGIDLRLVRIPAGQFVMGSESGYPDEAPRAVVRVPRPFAMGATEITCAQYAAFDPTHDNRYLDEDGKDHAVPGHIGNHPDQPVMRVSWYEAMAFCRWLSRTSGRKVRLPTEAEWEWAARAGTEQQFFYGDRNADFSKWANLADASRRRAYVRFDGGSRLHVPRNYPRDYRYPLRDDRFVDHWPLLDYVKQYPPNPWGLHDMVGNVSEWTLSDYRPYPYQTGGTDNPDHGPGKKVARGGSWTDRPVSAGSSVRFAYAPHQRVYNVGFRVVVNDVALAEFAHEPIAAVPRPPTCKGYVPYEVPYEMAVEGIAHSDGEFPPREMPAMVFDGSPRTKWFHPKATSTWLQFGLPEASRKPMVAYRISSANDCPHRDPKDWRLLGSNDGGKTWTTLDKQTDQVFKERHQARSFTLKSPEVYKTYRLCIDSPLAAKDGIQFSELVLVPR
jgi:formylglycine-generating enzyme required for sulfatase activity